PSVDVRTLAFLNDGRMLLSAGPGIYPPQEAAELKAMDVMATRPSRTFQGPGAMINFTAISPDGRTLAATINRPFTPTASAQVRLYDLATGRQKAVLRGHPTAVLALAFSADSRVL